MAAAGEGSAAVAGRRGVGQVHVDRDYHVHLGGAVPRPLVQEWAARGWIGGSDVRLLDLRAGAAPGTMLTVAQALDQVRGGKPLVEAYDAPYPDLASFLTMFRAYAPSDVVRSDAARICGCGGPPGVAPGREASADIPATSDVQALIAPEADIRVSVMHPVAGGDTARWAQDAVEEIHQVAEKMAPGQTLVPTFQRFEFRNDMNLESVVAFCQEFQRRADAGTLSPQAACGGRPAFDFASAPVRVHAIDKCLRAVKENVKGSRLVYHHGELVDDIDIRDRVRDMRELVPLADRLGHAICLGIAATNDPEHPVDPQIAALADVAERTRLRDDALDIIHSLAKAGVGIEINPTSNLTLGGARNLNHVPTFLRGGIDCYLGSDDPGFLATTLETERNLLQQAAATD